MLLIQKVLGPRYIKAPINTSETNKNKTRALLVRFRRGQVFDGQKILKL